MLQIVQVVFLFSNFWCTETLSPKCGKGRRVVDEIQDLLAGTDFLGDRFGLKNVRFCPSWIFPPHIQTKSDPAWRFGWRLRQNQRIKPASTLPCFMLCYRLGIWWVGLSTFECPQIHNDPYVHQLRWRNSKLISRGRFSSWALLVQHVLSALVLFLPFCEVNP